MSALLRLFLLVIPLVLLAAVPAAHAQPGGQYRAFWVDTYNTRLNTAADVTLTVDRARASGANTIFVQVRRRGDAWYLQGREPRPDGVPIDAGFDPLAEILAQAHGAGLEVHAFVVVGAIWGQTTLPSHPDHVFNTHGFSPAGPRAGAANWLTRTRLPDGAHTSYDGYRFGTDFWLDFGHPDAATYTVDVLLSLVTNYDIDGLHLDRLQYPEIGSGAGEGAPASVGYNDVSLQRFRDVYGRPAGADPAADDPDWSSWRRAQVTDLLRRIYLNVVAVKPRVKVSVGAVANGSAPGSEDAWLASDAYARVFQDWRHWTAEGLLDVVIPLAFRAEHTPAESESYAGWLAWTRDHQYQRQAAMGVGAYLNAIEGTLRQIRRAIEPASNPIDGVVLYSMGAHNAPVTRNPLAIPAGRDTTLRTFEDLSSGLRTGRTVAGQALEATGSANANATTGGVFAAQGVPMLFSRSSSFGHVMGTVRDTAGRPLDHASIVLQSESGVTKRLTSDGSGFFGATDLGSGSWRISVTPLAPNSDEGLGTTSHDAMCAAVVVAGQVARIDLEVPTDGPGLAMCLASSAGRRP